ncbi:hypothetical protein ACTWP5_01400 [Streptomyces sp. 4N509B]|uniref:hypothetical protein n=1 Tax=Streptomyces sp. 4N509B TaxID=3457413 RepID=UPI003FD58985
MSIEDEFHRATFDAPPACRPEGPERVDPAGIPTFTGDLALLETAHGALTDDAGAFRDIGAEVHSRFQGLSAYYQAPEAEQLFATTQPVRDRADDFASDLESVASALSAYADEIRPLVERLNTLRAEAHAFVDEIADDDDWRYDGGKTDRNNELLSQISTTVAEFWAAERRCANAITSLVGGTRWTVDDGSGGEHMYGMSVEDMSQAAETPWGQAVEEKRHWYEVHHHLKSFVWDGIIVDGIWGTLTGLGTLLNPWSDNFGAAWQGLGQLATGLAILAMPIAGPLAYGASRLLPEDNAVRGWIDDSMRTTVDVGKSLVAWDEWSENPARAAGLVTFNVVTTVATLGTGTAVRGTGAAATATTRALNAAARVGTVLDPMTYVGRGVSATFQALNIGDITANLAGLNALDATHLPDGGFRLPDGTVIPENFALDDLPPGAATLRLDDGTIAFPRDPDLPGHTGALLDPETGNLLLPDGTLIDEHGTVLQTPDQAPTSPADEAASRPAVRDPELATIGAHGPPDHLTAHAGDGLPGGIAPNGPTAQLGDNGVPPRGGGGGGSLDPRTGPAPSGGEPSGPIAERPAAGTGTDGPIRGGSTGDGVLRGGGSGSTTGDTPGGASWDLLEPRQSSSPGPMARGSEVEQAIRSMDTVRSRVDPGDLERALSRLSNDPAGQQIAEILASGRLNEVSGIDQVISSMGAHSERMYPGAAEQIRLADRLISNGVDVTHFEFKGVSSDGTSYDLDVRAHSADGSVYGYQLKEVSNPNKLFQKIQASLRQLTASPADHRIFVIDTNGSLADLVARNMPERLLDHYGQHRVMFAIRVDDGILYVPPDGQFYPLGAS